MRGSEEAVSLKQKLADFIIGWMVNIDILGLGALNIPVSPTQLCHGGKKAGIEHCK